MRLPFLQLADDFVESKSKTVAAILRIDHARAIGMGALLFAFILDETSTEEKPPDGILIDPEAASIFEGVMGWTGEGGKCADAFLRAKVTQKLDIGFRVLGTDRYRAAWEKAVKDRERKRLPRDLQRNSTRLPRDLQRNSDGIPGESRGKTETETYTEMKTEILLPSEVGGKDPPLTEKQEAQLAFAEGRGPPVPLPLLYEPPTTPEAEWDYEEFFCWAQSRRNAGGLVGEKHPRFEKLRTWWGVVVQSGVGVDRLKDAFYAYSDDDFWKEKKPPYPFLGFVSQWEKYVQQREVA